MGRSARPLAFAAVALVCGCGPAPRSFREATLAETEALLADPSVSVVEALDGAEPSLGVPRGQRWRLDGLPDRRQPAIAEGPVLVLGSSASAAHRSAAALARTGHEPVWVFVPETDQERAVLAASPVEAKESTRGEGS